MRPGLLNNGPPSGRARALVQPKDWRAGSVSRADVADFLAKQVADAAYVGKTPELIA